jgi:nucleotide-binding universal stress UspA family protein
LNLRTILCPVDLSDQSAHALAWAMAIAARHGSRVTVLTAVDPLLATAAKVRLTTDLVETESRPALREFVRSLVPETASWAPPIDMDVRVGDPPEIIVGAAARGQADLIVMGTHGLGGFRKLLLGSTAEQVLRRTPIPVLTIPIGDSLPVFPAGSGAPRLAMKALLVGTDFSETADRALQWAAGFAQDLGASLIVSHVVTPTRVPPQWQPYVADLDGDSTNAAESRLRDFVGQVKAPCTIVVSVGRPADALAALAREHEAGLIVVGLSRGGPAPGSIAYRVVSASQVPVLVVPADR